MKKKQKQIQDLVAEACRHPVGSAIRQKRLTQIIRLVADQLWHEHVPYYQDALQQTWIYFCQNLCESKTGCPYDPEKASVVTWLNNYLKYRLKDGQISLLQQRFKDVPNLPKKRGAVDKPTDPIDQLEAKPDIPPILDEVQQWAATDLRLETIHIKGRPEITGRLLVLKRLPPEVPWKDLSAELNVPIGTLASFYQRQCMPLLREFGQQQGYL